MALTPFRAIVPQLSFDVNRAQARTYGVKPADVLRRAGDLRRLDLCEPVHEYGRTFNVFAQADLPNRGRADAIKLYTVRNE